MVAPDDGESIGLFEAPVISDGSPAPADLNKLLLDLAEKSVAFRSGLPSSIAAFNTCLTLIGYGASPC